MLPSTTTLRPYIVRKKKLPTPSLTSLPCTAGPLPLSYLKLHKIPPPPVPPRRSAARSTCSLGSLSSSTKAKSIPPDEYYDSPPSRFGSRPSTSSNASKSVTPSTSTSKSASASVAPSTSNSKTPSKDFLPSQSSPGTSKPKSKKLNPKSPERDSGHGDFESELQFSTVSSPSLFDPVSESEETTDSCSYSNSYSYTCSNSYCTTGCFSDDEERSIPRSGSGSTRRDKPKSGPTENAIDSELLSNAEDHPENISFEAYLKRVEKLRKTLGTWDTFLAHNGISRPDFFCRFKERESLKQIVDEFQEITSRHCQGILSALEKRTWKSCEELGDVGLVSSGNNVRKTRRLPGVLDSGGLNVSGQVTWKSKEVEMESAESVLPIEVWGKVFQHSRPMDALNFRLVCSAWRTELNNNFDKWTARFDQNSSYFQHLLQLKVKKAVILDLLRPVYMSQGGQSLFKHPELLEKLSIPEDSQICPENLFLLLNSCEKTIKYLDLAVGCFKDVSTGPSCNLYLNRFVFDNLQSLELDLFSCSPRPILKLFLFKLMVGLSTMSKIRSLTLIISDLCINLVSSTILLFIGKNGRNLEVIDCDFSPNSEEEVPANSIDLALLRQVQRLQKIRIHYDCSRLGEDYQFPWEFLEAWSTLLEVQRNLTHLSLSKLPLSRRILRLVCHNSQSTLTKIELWYMDFDIDLAILDGCMHLKELRLTLFPSEQNGSTLRTARNARSLPVGIQKFESNYYFIESEDILDFFIGHGELVDFRLHHSGSYGLNGVTAAVFALFVINRDLRNKLRKMYIGGFNCSTAVDLTALNEIVRGLEDEWEDMEDFRNVCMSMERTRGKGGNWSVWGISTYCI